jgi:hypothetical protein
MKKTASLLSTVTIITVVTLIFSVFSCQKSQPANAGNPTSSNGATSVDKSASTKISGAPMKVNSVPVYVKVVDAHGQPPVGDATLLFDVAGHTPVTAPDGHQITLGEFNMASGWADVKCINTGTHVVVHLSGLIPNGVYTIWTMVMQSPGFDGGLANVIGIGPLGAQDGSENTFHASSAGTASLSATAPGGNLALGGSVGSCFSSDFEVFLSTVFHIDSQTHGGTPGDEPTWVFQSGFSVIGSELMNN